MVRSIVRNNTWSHLTIQLFIKPQSHWRKVHICCYVMHPPRILRSMATQKDDATRLHDNCIILRIATLRALQQVDFRKAIRYGISGACVALRTTHNKNNCSTEDKVFWDVTSCRLVNSYEVSICAVPSYRGSSSPSSSMSH